MVGIRLLGILMTAVSLASAAVPNFFCLTLHCLPELHSCRSDTDCNKALLCVRACSETDVLCNAGCMNSYEDPIFDRFMNCAATEHSCIHVSQANNIQCKTPHTVDTFHMASLIGTWYTIKGKNPAADCFDCQVTTFGHGTTSHQYSVHKAYDVLTIEGQHKQHTLVETVEQKSTGQLLLTGMVNGMHHTETWYILAATNNYIYAYYCGDTGGGVYDGGLVLSKTNAVTGAEMQEITHTAASNGLNIASYCSPKTTKCHDFNGQIIG